MESNQFFPGTTNLPATASDRVHASDIQFLFIPAVANSSQISKSARARWTYIRGNAFSTTDHSDPWPGAGSRHFKSLGRPDTHYSRDHAHSAVSHQPDRYPVSTNCDRLHCLRHTGTASHADCHQPGKSRVTL